MASDTVGRRVFDLGITGRILHHVLEELGLEEVTRIST